LFYSIFEKKMNARFSWIQLLIICLLLTLITGCGSTAQETPTPEPTAIPTDPPIAATPTPQPAEITFEVTFDENHNCTVSGPMEVPIGDYLISLNNLSEIKVDVAITHLIDGHNYQDLLDLQSEPGEPYIKEYWMSQPYYFTKDHKIWSYSLDEAGEHVILILQHVFEGIWICDPFQVMEVSSE
jgi:hypothetical protein